MRMGAIVAKRIAGLALAICPGASAQSLIEAERIAEVRQAFASPDTAARLRGLSLEDRKLLDELVRDLDWTPSQIVREGLRLVPKAHPTVSAAGIIGFALEPEPHAALRAFLNHELHLVHVLGLEVIGLTPPG
jgi:hypothetical protein